MILRPQDLRVGNYINYENTTHVVTELHAEKLIHVWYEIRHEGYVTRYDQVCPIPINVHEVERLGFVEDLDRLKYTEGYYDNMGYFIENDADTFWLCQHLDEDDSIRIATFEFVHELQNLYFDITKRELVY